MAEKKSIPKGAKKKFFDVKVPLTSSKASVYAFSPEEIEGKIIKIDLTRSLRGKSFDLKSRVKNEAGVLVGEPISLILNGSYIRSMVRRGIDYVEDSFETECRDFNVHVKTFLITRKRVSRNVRKVIREEAAKYIKAQFKVKNVNEIMSNLMSGKFQKDLSLKLKKIYPLALCEIKSFEVIEKKS